MGLPTPTEIEAYRRDGVVCLRGVLTADEVDAARAGIDEVVAHPGPLALTASRADDPGRFVEDFRRWGDVASIEAVARHSALPAIVAALLGASQVRLHHDHVLVKEAATSQRTPWHQDQPYYDIEGDQVISVWMPVDPVPLGAGLEVVAGTHRGPWLMPRTFLAGEAKWFPEGSLAELPDIEADRGAFDIRTFAMEPGDGLCFHGLAVHGAPGFPGPGRRRVLSVRYVGDDVRRAPRHWRTSPPFPELDGVLAADAPLDHPLFPVVWPS